MTFPRRPIRITLLAASALLLGCGQAAPSAGPALPTGVPGATAVAESPQLSAIRPLVGTAGTPARQADARSVAFGPNLFDAATWAPGALAAALDGALRASEDPLAAGRWTDIYDTDADRATYRATLGTIAVEAYDPKRFLRTLGLTGNPRGPGRDDDAMLRAWRLTDYQPDPRYFPGPASVRGWLQKTLLRGARLSPGAIEGLDRAATATVIRMMEKADRLDPHPFGEESDILPGARQPVLPAVRYDGVVMTARAPRAWGHGIHQGSIAPEATAAFGTYDIARHLGFTDAQARHIAVEDFDVDLDATHYQDDGHVRKTASGTGGANGDMHWHFNRARPGEEDTRLQAARLHLARAVAFARDGRYDTAENELGIGLHSLQDMFSHGQITPINHALVGEFPDLATYHPTAAFETLIATEGYMNQYVKALGLAPAPRALSTGTDAGGFDRPAAIARMVGGDAAGEARAQLETLLATWPDGLVAYLDRHGVLIVLDQPGAPATARGFGRDLDGDGRVSPGQWVDVDGDGEHAAHETEDALPDGRSWTQVPAGYDPARRMIWLSADDLASLPARLRHEAVHAADDLLSRDPALGERWQRFRDHAFRLARRSGAIAFAERDVAEHLAETL